MNYLTVCEPCGGGIGQQFPCVCSIPYVRRIVSENDKLRAELATSNCCLFQMQEAAKLLSAELAELRAQVPAGLVQGCPSWTGQKWRTQIEGTHKFRHGDAVYISVNANHPAAVPDDVAKGARLAEVWNWCLETGADFLTGNARQKAIGDTYRAVADHIRGKHFGGCKHKDIFAILAANKDVKDVLDK